MDCAAIGNSIEFDMEEAVDFMHRSKEEAEKVLADYLTDKVGADNGKE